MIMGITTNHNNGLRGQKMTNYLPHIIIIHSNSANEPFLAKPE